MLIPPCSMVSKILRAKHKYHDQVVREPSPVDRAQSKISKPLEQLEESAPWSSWSEITEAASSAMKVPGSLASSNRQRHESQGNAVDNKGHSMLKTAAWTTDCSGMSTPEFARSMWDVWQDELYDSTLQLFPAPRDVFSQDRTISPPMSSPLLPARATSDRRETSSPKPEQDFWTGRRQSHRPSSVQSYGSSRNSSLHGSPAIDPSYQSPVFSPEDQKHGTPEASNSPRGLLPAPIDWTVTQSRDQVSKRFSFDCEICGEVVKASRRLDWQ